MVLLVAGLILALILGVMIVIYTFSHPELTRTQITIYNLNNNLGKTLVDLALVFGGRLIIEHFTDIANRYEYKILKYYQSLRNKENRK
jgi:hypothetical protein